MEANYILNTSGQLCSQLEVESNAIKECKAFDTASTATIDPEHRDFVEYMHDHQPDSLAFRNGYARKSLIGKVLVNVLNDISAPIVFRELNDFYYFSIKGNSFSVIFPLLATRAIFCLLKLYGVKCIIYKRDRNVCPKEAICCSELAFLGKTDTLLPGFKFIADACKKFKGRATPWYSLTDPIPDPSDSHPDEATLRFSGAPWFSNAHRDVTLIGCGGLGSNIAVSLCRVLGGNSLSLYDGDRVEHRNLAGQNFGISDIGKFKAQCVSEQCKNFNPSLHVYTHNNFERGDQLSDIVITGLDNMASRNLVFYEWQNNSNKGNINMQLLIDARLSAEKWQIFCIRGNDRKAQEEYASKWLFSDSEAASDVCSYKQTAFAAQMCASFVTNLYINFCSNLDKVDTNPFYRFLPFMTEYDASQLHLKFTEL